MTTARQGQRPPGTMGVTAGLRVARCVAPPLRDVLKYCGSGASYVLSGGKVIGNVDDDDAGVGVERELEAKRGLVVEDAFPPVRWYELR